MESKQIKRIEKVTNSRKKKLEHLKEIAEKVKSEEENQRDIKNDYDRKIRSMKFSRHRNSVDLDDAHFDTVKLLERGWNKRNFAHAEEMNKNRD